MQLYPHQQDLLFELRQALSCQRTAVLVLSTGGGKSWIAAFMIKSAIAKGKRVIFQVHRRSLVRQMSQLFTQIGISHSFIAAGYSYDPSALCYVAIVHTLARRIKKIPPPDFLITDEAHLSLGKQFSSVINWAREANAFSIGCTATPKRYDGKGLEKHYEAIVEGQPISWLIENKYLSTYKYYAPKAQIDKSEFRIKHGDYDVTQLAAATGRSELIGNVVQAYKQFAGGKRMLLFAPTVKVSMNVVEALNAAGIPAAHLDGGDNDEIREEEILAFADGHIKVLSNVNLFAEGFDLSSYSGKEVQVDGVMIYTATASLSRYLQIIGRALRAKPYPAIIIDFGFNCGQHDMPDATREWSLKDERVRLNKGVTIVRQCQKCYFVHRPSPTCPECGYVYPIKERKVNAKEGELIEITAKINYESDCRTLQHWHILAKKLGKKPGWAYMRWKQRRWTPNLNHA